MPRTRDGLTTRQRILVTGLILSLPLIISLDALSFATHWFRPALINALFCLAQIIYAFTARKVTGEGAFIFFAQLLLHYLLVELAFSFEFDKAGGPIFWLAAWAYLFAILVLYLFPAFALHPRLYMWQMLIFVFMFAIYAYDVLCAYSDQMDIPESRRDFVRELMSPDQWHVAQNYIMACGSIFGLLIVWRFRKIFRSMSATPRHPF